MNFFDYLYAVVPMLGLLIFVHELGHFVVAKLCGVRVLKFSLGFGSPIGFGNARLRWVRGGTEYVIAWFPLGGFVKMLGEQMAGVQGEEGEFVEDASPDEYLNAKRTWQKLAITFAGPAMNLLLPVVIFVVILWFGMPQRSPVVGMVEGHSPAAAAGLEPGDRILTVAGEPITTWGEFEESVRSRRAGTLSLEIDRAGERLPVELGVDERSGLDDFGGVIDVGWVGVGHRRLPALLGIAKAEGPAALAGLRSGDRVLRISGPEESEVEDWEALWRLYAAARTDSVVFHVVRLIGESEEEAEVTVPVLGDLEALGVVPAAILVRSVSEDMPAALAGLQPGDLILAVDGRSVGSFATFAQIVRSSEGRSLSITYARAGKTDTVALRPKQASVPGPLEIEGMEQKVYLIGITHALATLPGTQHLEQELNPLVSIPRAVGMTIEVGKHFLRGMGKLIGGEVGLDNVAGPIGIAEIARKSLDLGWQAYVSTLILISINLGFLNLLPIPILDGGQALIFAIEGIKRSPISSRSREIVQQIGFTFLVMLMGLAFWNDLSRHWSSFVEWLRGTGL